MLHKLLVDHRISPFHISKCFLNMHHKGVIAQRLAYRKRHDLSSRFQDASCQIQFFI